MIRSQPLRISASSCHFMDRLPAAMPSSVNVTVLGKNHRCGGNQKAAIENAATNPRPASIQAYA
ncbi:hypothetical protein LCGC14_1763850 [marine sediment metagenome]|uniref:Uncharacterized protein n=1 Tax=marine sediment metagenome TaxID=412755 RepID=A0A0F9JZX5_9ZZZZ